MKRNTDSIKYEQVEIWPKEWHCNICGVAQKKGAEADAGVAEKMMSKTNPPKRPPTRNPGKPTTARVEANGMVGLAECAEGHTCRERERECAPTWAKVDRHIPTLRRGHRGDQGVAKTGPSTMELTLGSPSHTRAKARRRTMAKEEKGGKGKGKGHLSGLRAHPSWEPQLGQLPYWDETCCPPESVPLCAAVRNVTEEDDHGWKRKKRHADHDEGRGLCWRK